MNRTTVAYPRVRKALARAIGNTLDSLPSDVRQEIRGRWRWTIAPLLRHDGCTVAHTARNNVITFDPEFIERLMDAGQDSAAESLICHELAHVRRNLRGETLRDRDADEQATNRLMQRWGFGWDLRRLRELSGY